MDSAALCPVWVGNLEQLTAADQAAVGQRQHLVSTKPHTHKHSGAKHGDFFAADKFGSNERGRAEKEGFGTKERVREGGHKWAGLTGFLPTTMRSTAWTCDT